MDEIEAGRELDAWIAEKFMGQTDFEHDEVGETATWHPFCIRCKEVGSWGGNMFGGSRCIKRYSENIAAAWLVFEELRKRYRIVGIWATDVKGERVWEVGVLGRNVYARDAALAICLAARASVSADARSG